MELPRQVDTSVLCGEVKAANLAYDLFVAQAHAFLSTRSGPDA